MIGDPEVNKELPRAAPFSGRIIAAAVNFLSSVKLAVVLLIILAAVSIIGTILFQGESAQDNIRLFTNAVWGLYNKLGLVKAASPESVERYHRLAQEHGLSLYNLSKGIGLDRLYNTWYFNLLLVLLSLNLIVCSLRHWPHTWKFFKQPKLVLEGEGAAGIPLRREIAIKGTAGAPTAFSEGAAKLLSGKGYRVRVTEADGARHLFAQRGLWGRLGIYTVHLSVLIIFIGAFIGFQLGKKGFVNIEEGSAVDSLELRGGKGEWKLPFSVRCDDFEVTYYDNRQPKDFKSKLTVLEGGREVLTKTIEVNDPLIYPSSLFNLKSIYFYQSSYGETGKSGTIKLEVSDTAGIRKQVYTLPLNRGEFSMPEFGLTAELMRFVPDFAMEGSRIYTKSNQAKNPAMQVNVALPDGKSYSTWVFLNFPEVQNLAQQGYNLTFLDYDGSKYTGLQVAYDPGTWIVWIGCGLMILGIFIAFFVPHRRIWVKIVPREKGAAVWMAGSTNKNKTTFEDEFESLAAGMQEALAS